MATSKKKIQEAEQAKLKYGIDITKATEDEYVKAGLNYYKKEAKELGASLDVRKQTQFLKEEYSKLAIPKAEAAKPVTPEVKEPWEMTRQEAHEAWVENMNLPQGQRVPTPNMFFMLTDEAAGHRAWIWFEKAVKTDRRIAQTDFHHRWAIEQALSEGKPVPPEVLADYPDLQKAKPAVSTSERIIELDRKHTLPELQSLCRQKGLSTSGDKKTLIRRLF